ncbi:polysaccharide biosynthesis tyrosine autokinase [Poriferisphaera corsica]|nr:polysaccharide biosynthesis tyrosine autokinase [Poriferisphaera corsica]
MNNNNTNVPASAANPLGNKFKPVDPVKILRQYLWLIIPVCLLSPIFAGGVWFIWNKTAPKWQSKQVFQVQAGNVDVRKASMDDLSTGQINMIEAYMQTQSMRMQSEDVFASALNNPDLKKTDWYLSFNDKKPQMVKSLKNEVIGTYIPRDSLLIVLSASTKNGDDSKEIVAAVRDAYLRSLQTSSVGDRRLAEAALVEELKRAEQAIERLNRNIQTYASEKNVVLQRQSSIDLQVKEYTEQLVQLEASLIMTKKTYDILVAQQSSGDLNNFPPEDEQAVDQLPIILGMQQQLNSLESDLKAHLRMYPKNHQTSIYKQNLYEEALDKLSRERNQRLRDIQAAKISEAQNGIETFTNQISGVRPNLDRAQKELTDLSSNIQFYQNLIAQRDAEMLNKEKTQQALNDLRLSLNRSDLDRVQAIGRVTAPILVSPKITVIVPVITFLLVGTAIGLIFLKEVLNQYISSPGDVKLINGAELLSVIPSSTEDKQSKSPIERIVLNHPTSLIAESYRQTRTAILRKMERSGYKTLMIVAAQPGSGASVNIHNIATSLSVNGKNVVILDANIRKPNQHILCNTNSNLGWTDLITGHGDLSNIICDSNNSEPALVPVGNTTVAPEAFESKDFRELLTNLEARYDYVIIDAPPLLLTSDSQILSKIVDAVAIVVHAAQDKRGMVERLQNKMRGNRAELLGLILNGVQSSAGGYFKKNYEAFHRYSASANERGNASRAAAVSAMQDQTDSNA